ncbi:MAG TPA: helix-turn-helix transcriptional regulator [Niabella sp.]
MTLAEKMINIRRLKGLTQVEIAQILSVTQGAIQHLEKGATKSLSESLLKSLIFTLGVNPYYLLSDDNNEPVFSSGTEAAALRKKIKQYEAVIDKLIKIRG